MSPPGIASWLDHLAPTHGARVGEAFGALPLRPVYDVPPDLTDVDRHLQGAEWSLRVGPAGVVDRARVMVAVDAPRATEGALQRALAALGPGIARGARVLAERLRRERPDLDLLLGADLGRAPRAKLYVLRPAGRPVDGFADLARAVLGAHGVAPGWTADVLDRAGRDPAFFALDLHADGRTGGKLYLSATDRDDADVLLAALDRQSLRERLRCLGDVDADHAVGRFVVTPRARGTQTVDVTLHAHLGRDPPLSRPLSAAWQAVQDDARRVLGRTLRASYVSWLDGPTPSESLYYRVSPD